MTESPWQSHSRAAPERDYVALVSYLPLNSGWSIPRLLLYATRIRRQQRTSAGLVGYSLRARLAAKRFWTLSAWEDEMALRAFVAAPPHATVMKALAPHMGATAALPMAQNHPDPASRLRLHQPALVATPGASEWVSCVSSPATNRSGRTLEKGAGNLANWPAG